jgi:hypothetical protein
MAPALAPQRMEVRRPVVAGDRGLAVNQERRYLDAVRSVNDGGEAVGSTPLRVKQADAQAIPAHHQPITVMLDFVNPDRAGRRSHRLRRQARFDEAGGTLQARHQR